MKIITTKRFNALMADQRNLELLADKHKRLESEFKSQIALNKSLMDEKVALECEKAALEERLKKFDHRSFQRNERGHFKKQVKS